MNTCFELGALTASPYHLDFLLGLVRDRVSLRNAERHPLLELMSPFVEPYPSKKVKGAINPLETERET